MDNWHILVSKQNTFTIKTEEKAWRKYLFIFISLKIFFSKSLPICSSDQYLWHIMNFKSLVKYLQDSFSIL